MPARSSKRPKNAYQLGKLVVDLSVGNSIDFPDDSHKNPAAVALGRLGGKKGGAARAASLSARKRKQIAVKAANTRWGKSRDA